MLKTHKEKNFKLRCGAKNWRKFAQNTRYFFAKDEEQTYRGKISNAMLNLKIGQNAQKRANIIVVTGDFNSLVQF